MKKDRYIYPAILSYDNDGISIEFPDLPGCLPCAINNEDAFKNAREALALHLYGMEKENIEIPAPTEINQIKIKDNQAIMMVEVWMPLYRDIIENKSENKTITIPKWLNDIVKDMPSINCSKILQEALIEKLGLNNSKNH